MVQKVYTELSSYGFECFVDQYGIAPGSSWRHQLRQSLVNADYVICFCDSISVQKPWPASELEAAVRLRQTSSNINIIAVTPQDMKDETIQNILPVFRNVFLNEGEPSRFIKVARESGDLMDVLSCHSIIIQEDFLDKSISADNPLLLVVPFLFWKLSASVAAMLRFLLAPAAMAAAFVIAAKALISGASFSQAIHAVSNTLTTGITGTPQLVLYGILLMCFCSSLLEIIHRHIVTKPARPLSSAKKMQGRIFSVVQLIYVIAFLTFVPVFTVINAENWAIFFAAGFYGCCGIALRYANRLDLGKVARCDNFLSGYNVANNPIETPQPWVFMAEQQYVLAGRPQLLKAFHSYINNFNGSYNPAIFPDSVVNGLRLYGTAARNLSLLNVYTGFQNISERLNKCGFSYNMMAVYDDIAETAAFSGKYEEAITAYMRKCECMYASFYSTYKDYSDIYETQYRIAWLYRLLSNRDAAHKYATLALRGLKKNIKLGSDHIYNDIYAGHGRGAEKRTLPLLVLWRTIRNRSLTIGFKLMTDKNKRLISEIHRFLSEVQ
jgi:tetratricopeptide (TPR) repeat protein